MGLMGGSNPYFVENPIAAALNGLRSGGMDGYKSALDKRKMDAEIANQQATRAQQQQLVDIQTQAAQQKQAEVQRLDEYRKANLAAQSPVAASVQMPGQSMPLGGGLLSGQELQVAPMEQRVMTQPDPMAVQQKQAALYQQYDPEGYGKMMAENAMKPQAINPILSKLIDAAQNGSIDAQGKALLERSGYGGMFQQKPNDKETWGEPFESSIAGKRALVQKSSYGQVRPVIQDTSTTVRVSNGDNRRLAQSTFVSPDGVPLLFDKDAGTYIKATIQGGGSAAPKPNALTPESATKLEMLDTTIRLVPQIREQMFDKNGNVGWADVANAQVRTWGTKGRKIATDINQAVEQVLRVESGAAVPEAEVTRAAARFKPQIGDTKEIIAGKLENLEKFVTGARDKVGIGRSASAQGREVVQTVAPKVMTSLPPASQHKGRTVMGSDGIKRKSNGTKWELSR